MLQEFFGENPVSQHPDFLESSSLLPGPGLVMIQPLLDLRFAQKHQMKPHSFPASLLITVFRRYFLQALELWSTIVLILNPFYMASWILRSLPTRAKPVNLQVFQFSWYRADSVDNWKETKLLICTAHLWSLRLLPQQETSKFWNFTIISSYTSLLMSMLILILQNYCSINFAGIHTANRYSGIEYSW